MCVVRCGGVVCSEVCVVRCGGVVCSEVWRCSV